MHFSFRTILFLAYTIPNIYVFLRIRHLFIGRRYRLWYTVVYLLLACIYPITREWSANGWIIETLNTISDYLLPLYLYIFLLLLAIDILLLFNLAFKIIPKNMLRSSRFRNYVFASILATDVLIVVYGIINMNTIRTSEYQISVPKRSSHLNHLRIAFASDFHLQEWTGTDFMKRFEKKNRGD